MSKSDKETFSTVKYSSLSILNNPKVATHTIAGAIDETSYKDFHKFLTDVYEKNQKIDDEELKIKEENDFNRLHDPASKPKFKETKTKIERINLVIDSYGGLCCSMTNITALMMSSPIPIDTYCFGVAMSAGFMIFIHGERRYIGEAVNLMTHSLSSSIYDNAPAMLVKAEHLDKMNKIYQGMISSKTGLSTKWLEDNQERNVYFTADEVLEHKIADVLVKY